MFPLQCFLLKCVSLPEISTLAFTLLSISWFYPLVGYWCSILECNLLRAVHSVHLGKNPTLNHRKCCCFFYNLSCWHGLKEIAFSPEIQLCLFRIWYLHKTQLKDVTFALLTSEFSFMSQYKKWNCDNILKLCITLDNGNNLSTISQKLYRTAFLLATSPIHNRCLCLMSANIGEGMCCNLCLKDTFVWCPVLVTVTVSHRQHIHLWDNVALKV